MEAGSRSEFPPVEGAAPVPPLARYVFPYALLGLIAGMTVPFLCWMDRLWAMGLEPTLENVLRIHLEDPVLGCVSLVPLLAGLAFAMRRHRLWVERRLNADLAEALRQRDDALRCAESDLEKQTSELARLSALYQSSAQRFEMLFQGLPIACFTHDERGVIFEWNTQFEHLFGFQAHELMERTVYETICRPEDEAECRELVKKAFEGGPGTQSERLVRKKDGTEFWVLCTAIPMLSPSGGVSAVIRTCVDISERKAMEARIQLQVDQLEGYAKSLEFSKLELEKANVSLEMLASTDALTGVANRRVFRETLDAEVEKARSGGTPLSLVFMDIDRFKDYNDAFGHGAGDDVLKRIADILGQCVRMSDLAARYGGEEFVVVLSGADRAAAVKAAERMRKKIETTDWLHRPVTASFGVATMSGEDTCGRELLQAADAALYLSKEAGRNRVTHACELQSGTKKTRAA